MSTIIRTPYLGCPRLVSLLLLIVCAGVVTGAAWACDNRVTFDMLAPGSVYSNGTGYPVGSLLFSEDGIDVRSTRLHHGGGWSYGEGIVDFPVTAPYTFGSGLIFRPQGLGLNFDLTSLGIIVTEVRFRWLDTGGIENLRVNGGPLYVGDIDAAPSPIAPGIACNVMVTPVPGGLKGGVRLLGPVRRFTVAGQEFAIDNVCVIGLKPLSMEPISIAFDRDDLDGLAGKSAAAEGTSWGSLKAQYR